MTPATIEKPQSTYQPVKKVTYGAFAGALVTLTVFLLNTHHPSFQDESRKIPGEISGAATTILTFIVSYLVPPGKEEAIVMEDGVPQSAKQ